MSTVGKVFAVLNSLLAIVFMLLVAPVVDYRTTEWKKINAEEAKVPSLVEERDKLEVGRMDLIDQIQLKSREMEETVTTGQNEQSTFQSRIARVTDRENDAKSRKQSWDEALQNVTAEIDARRAEAKKLDETIAAERDRKQLLTDSVTRLTDQKTKTLADLGRTMGALRDKEKQIRDLEQKVRPSSASERVAGAPRQVQ